MIKNSSNKAFTIIELSVVLLIVAVLLTSFFSVSRKVIENAGVKVTRDKMEEIYKAMGRYLETYGRLPCPASMQLAKTSTSYGKSVTCISLTSAGLTSAVGIWQSPWNSNMVYGMVPIKDLGLATDMAEDGFGSKITYVVIKGYTSAATFGIDDDANYTGNGTGHTYNPDGVDDNRIRIHEKLGSSYKRITASGMFVLISYGPNKNCAFKSTVTTQNAASSDGDETFNCASELDQNPGRAYFYSYWIPSSLYPFIIASDSDVFDDILFFKTRDKMLMDFDLLSLAKCMSTTYNSLYGSTNITWPNASYNQVMPANTACPSGYIKGPAFPTRKCGALGVWSGVINPCLQ